ncbi:IclR family transcriptional regulator [Microbacterium sp. RD1]|uniref:IclR family transcriptional regulator n=1 Tax=Microbacterium sp. RD1 TaxID=3457313 RepID=UPI003FA5EA98
MQNAQGSGDSAVPYAVESVISASQILLMLRTTNELHVGRVAQELSVARSTAHRLLTTLQSQGLLAQVGPRQPYTAGPALVEIGSRVVGAVDLKDRARPLLERLARDTGETSHLLVLHGSEVIFVDGVEGSHVIRAGTRIGASQPAHISAAGKALLAELPHDELLRRFPDDALTGGTPKALKTRSKLIDELTRTARRGYAINRSESEVDLYAVSAVVRNFEGAAIGAISVSGPASRVEGRIEEIAGLLRDLVGNG